MCHVQNSLLHAKEVSLISPQAAHDVKLYKFVRLYCLPQHFARTRLSHLSGRHNAHPHLAMLRRRVKCYGELAFSEEESVKDPFDQSRTVSVDGADHFSQNGVDGSLTKGQDPGMELNNIDTFRIKEMGTPTSENVVLAETTSHEAANQHADATELPVEQELREKSGKDVASKPPKVFSRFSTLFAPAWEAAKGNPLVEWINQWSIWQEKRRLEHLLRQADANPMDASKQSALLAELNKHSPEAVIKRFEQREHATNAQCVVEYLRALLLTNGISEYLPDERSGKSASLPALLQELKQRAAGSLEEPFTTPGLTDKHPLHVVMVDAKGASKSMRFVQELISTCLFMIFFSVMWVMFAAFLRKYVSSMGGMGPSTGISTNTAYAPKEYNKETLPEKNTKTFKDVKGCDEAKEELEEIVEYLKDPTKFTRLGGKLPKGVLLTGPPGTGKTLLAKAIAGEAGVPFFYRAGSEFEEMFVGVGARRVRALFQAAKKKAPCIVFIDEIDAIGSTRKQWEGHTKKTLHQLLVEMDGFEANEGIIVVAATNLPEILDPALTRPGRFDRHVVVTNPDVRGRQEILELYLLNKPVADDVDVKMLARSTPGFNGADLANLVNMAALKAAVDGTETITGTQLEFAKDKIVMGTERKSFVQSDESRKLTAYHESGHAVVALNTAGAHPIHKATIMPRGNALGMVSQIPDKDETSVSKLQLLARLDVAMGGRVAEEIIFGTEQVTTGARSDLQHATALARHMVSECGMSDSVGPIFIAVDDQRPSQDIQRNIDAEVVRLLKEAYERVKTLLKKRESDLHALANALLEHETLTSKQIKQILSPFQQTDETTPEAAS
eukprot:c24820_g1_i1 orf=343-2865(-)